MTIFLHSRHQVNADLRSPGLPLVVTNSSHKESSEAPRAFHQLEDVWWGEEQPQQDDRAPYRSFTMPKMVTPPPSQQQQQRPLQEGSRIAGGVEERTLAWSERTRGYGGGPRAVAGGQVVEGFREGGDDPDDPTSSPGSWDEVGEGGFNVLLDGGTEERKGGLTSPPFSRKASV